MFDVAIDSRLRGCGIVKIKIGDLVSGGRVRSRAIVIQQKNRKARAIRALAHAASHRHCQRGQHGPAQMVCVITWEPIAYTTARRQIYPE
jgi:hypothetical protein